MQNFCVGFQRLKNEYPQYSDFGIIYKESVDNSNRTQSDFLIREGYLFKCIKLCISRNSLRDFLV